MAGIFPGLLRAPRPSTPPPPPFRIFSPVQSKGLAAAPARARALIVGPPGERGRRGTGQHQHGRGPAPRSARRPIGRRPGLDPHPTVESVRGPPIRALLPEGLWAGGRYPGMGGREIVRETHVHSMPLDRRNGLRGGPGEGLGMGAGVAPVSPPQEHRANRLVALVSPASRIGLTGGSRVRRRASAACFPCSSRLNGWSGASGKSLWSQGSATLARASSGESNRRRRARITGATASSSSESRRRAARKCPRRRGRAQHIGSVTQRATRLHFPDERLLEEPR